MIQEHRLCREPKGKDSTSYTSPEMILLSWVPGRAGQLLEKSELVQTVRCMLLLWDCSKVQSWAGHPVPLPGDSHSLLPIQQPQLLVELWDNPCPALCSRAGQKSEQGEQGGVAAQEIFNFPLRLI